MPDLFTNGDDSLLEGLPGAFLAGLDLAHAARRIPPYLRHRCTGEQITVAEWLRQGWNQRFDAQCRVLNHTRLQAVVAALNAEFTPLEIGWAIVAYHRECTTDRKRLEQPSMRRSFERFLLTDCLERYIPLGQKIRDEQQAGQRRQADRAQRRREETTVAGLEQQLARMTPDQQQHLVERAVHDLKARDQMTGPETISNHLVRSKVLQLIQQDASRDQLINVTPVSDAITGALSI